MCWPGQGRLHDRPLSGPVSTDFTWRGKEGKETTLEVRNLKETSLCFGFQPGLSAIERENW